MMIPQLLNPELPRNTPPAYPRLRAPSLALCLMGVLGMLSCKGSIDNNEQRSSLQPNGRNGGTTAGSGGATGAPPPFATTSPGDGEQNPDIRGLDGESADDTSSSRGGTRRRPAARDRDEDEDVDAGVDEPLEDAGVLVDAGDGGVVEVDGGLAADAGG
ncbi:MAG: hypothetical protein RL033_6981 [Pseudomonadota bacterium]